MSAKYTRLAQLYEKLNVPALKNTETIVLVLFCYVFYCTKESYGFDPRSKNVKKMSYSLAFYQLPHWAN